MDDFIDFIIIIALLAIPTVCAIVEHAKRKKSETVLRELFFQQKISAADMQRAGLLPKQPEYPQMPPVYPMQPGYPPPQGIPIPQIFPQQTPMMQQGMPMQQSYPQQSFPAPFPEMPQQKQRGIILEEPVPVQQPAAVPMPAEAPTEIPIPIKEPAAITQPQIAPAKAPFPAKEPAAIAQPQIAPAKAPVPAEEPAAITQPKIAPAKAPVPAEEPAAITQPKIAPAKAPVPAEESAAIAQTEVAPAETPVSAEQPAVFPEQAPAFSSKPAADHPAAVQEPALASWLKEKPPAPPKEHFTISAITVMLSVGVVLIVIAGLVFIRSQWSSLSGVGKLLTLGSGSLLFFGSSALASRVWKLKRTGMAFFSLGAFFLPISIWAAGYLNLLGPFFSGGGNPRLITIVFAAFTVISFIATREYQQVGWAVGFLFGGTVTFLYFIWALLGTHSSENPARCIFLSAMAVPALALGICSKKYKIYIPLSMRRTVEPYGRIYSIISAITALIAAANFAAISKNEHGTERIVLITVALLVFTVIALISMLCYEKKTWSYCFLTGATVAFLCGVDAILSAVKAEDSAELILTLAVAVPAIVFAFLAKRFAEKLPAVLQSPLPKFGRIYSVLAGIYTAGYAVFSFFNGIDDDKEPTKLLFYATAAFAAFALLSLASALAYQKSVWGACFLTGCTAAFLCGVDALLGNLRDTDTGTLMILLSLILPALVFAILTRKHPAKLPDSISEPIPIFGQFYSGVVLLATFLFSSFQFNKCMISHNFEKETAAVWIMTAAIAVFTVISLIAAAGYRFKVWSAVFFSGLSASVLSTVWTLTGHSRLTDTGAGIVLLASAVWALLLAFGSRFIREKLPEYMRKVIEPFAMFYAFCAALQMFGILSINDKIWLSGIACFLTSLAFYAPAVTDRIRSFAAAPISLMTLLGFGGVLTEPLSRTTDLRIFSFADTAPFVELILLLTVAGFLLLLIANALPEVLRKGFLISAYVITTAYMLEQMLRESPNVIVLALAAIVNLLLLKPAWNRNKVIPSLAVELMTCIILLSFTTVVRKGFSLENPERYRSILPAALAAIVIYFAFRFNKHIRVVISDFLFPLTAFFLSKICLNLNEYESHFNFPSVCIMFAACMIFLFNTFWKDKKLPQNIIHAILVPITLFVSCMELDSLKELAAADSFYVMLLWTLLSLGIGFFTYYRTKGRFHAVRKLLFCLTIIPPILAAFFMKALDGSPLDPILQIVCAVACALLWLIFSGHGFRVLSSISFVVTLLLLSESTIYLVRDGFYDGESNFNVILFSTIWTVIACVLALLINGRVLNFVGKKTVTDVMRFVTPITALILTIAAVYVEQRNWDTFYFVYPFTLCVLSWFVTRKTDMILPSFSVLAMLESMESLRCHLPEPTDGIVAVWILVYAGLVILFPYLGVVLREGKKEGEEIRRTWVLTGAGGAVPLWMIMTAIGLHGIHYEGPQIRWILFMVPMLYAGYLLHFRSFAKTESVSKGITAAAGVLTVIALWMQPLVSTKDTYFEGKLHLIPLIAFGVLLRYLYGVKTGGTYLFVIGIYSMIRLGISAIVTENPEDMFTVLFVALLMFLASFYVKQKKWFLLGGISLIIVAVYMCTKLSSGIEWWVYLLFAGLILIVVAGTNEMMKMRGESLKTKAGRLWDDWQW